MFTDSEADRLLRLPKRAIDGALIIDLNKEKTRINLVSDDEEFEFLFQYHRTLKVSFFRMSCHHLVTSGSIGILRVCYGKRHTNPIVALSPNLTELAGISFDIDEPHAHFYVRGYPNLDWARPVLQSGYTIKVLNNINDLETIIREFCSLIHLNSQIHIQNSLL